MKRIIYALIFTLTVCLAVDAAAPKKLEVRRVDFEEIRKFADKYKQERLRIT